MWRAGHLMRLDTDAVAAALVAAASTSTPAQPSVPPGQTWTMSPVNCVPSAASDLAARAVGYALMSIALVQGADRSDLLKTLGPQLCGTLALAAGRDGAAGAGAPGWRHAAVLAVEVEEAAEVLGLGQDVKESFAQLSW